MKQSLLILVLLSFSIIFLCSPVNAIKYSFLGGELSINLLVDAMNLSLADQADAIYLGTINSNWRLGIGNESSLLFPIAGGVSAGPHFIFDYNTFSSTWHSFENFQTSLGGIIDFNLGGGSHVAAHVDYNLGWFTAEQTITSVPGSPDPAGAFAGGLPGFIFGVKAYTMFSDTLGIGAHFNMGTLTLAGVKYKNNSGDVRWMDAAVGFSQVGLNIYF